jgi:RpiB/LacA/LacB family sugar-phosphate isomerase
LDGKFGARIEGLVDRTFGREAPGVTSRAAPVPSERVALSRCAAPRGLKVAIGSDQRGMLLKKQLVEYLSELGHTVVDCGLEEGKPGDYPDVALAVAERVARKTCDFGIVIDAVGIGSAIAANKVRGIRAATSYDVESARSSRMHNDANILSLGSGFVNRGLARRMVRTWLETSFEGGRHVPRIEKIEKIERDGLDARL